MGVRIREKPKGSGEWWIFINHHGRRKSKKVGSDQKVAREMAAKIAARLTLGDYNLLDEGQAPRTFGTLFEEWLALHVKPARRATTHDRYRAVYRMYLKKHLDGIAITDLKRADVLKVLRSVRAHGLSRSSVESARNVISGVCEYAIDGDLIASNPCTGALKRIGIARRTDRKPIQIFTREEVALLLDTCQRYRPRSLPFFLAAFRTGLRLGEILALRWDNVNWNGRYIVVEQSFRNSRLTGTKTGRVRKVDLSNQLFTELRELYRRRKAEALKAGTNEVCPIIFHTDGKHTSQNTVRHIWKGLLAKAGLEYRKFHSIRHTFASLLIADGHSLTYIKEALGHGSIQITVDVYRHLLPSESKGAVNSLDDASERTPAAPWKTDRAVTH